MGKIVYVKGSIFVSTRYFSAKDIGVGYLEPPEGTDIVINPQDNVDGFQCLLIDDAHPRSLFDEYYVKDDVVTGYIAPSYLSASYLDSIYEYKKRIGETCDVIKKVSDWGVQEQSVVYKMAFVNILTALDAFICYVLVKRSVQDENLFRSFMFDLAPSNKTDFWNKMIQEERWGEWEQDAIQFALGTSFLNVDRIDKCFNSVGFKRLIYNRNNTKSFFRLRHLLVHRSGKQRDDSEVEISYALLSELIQMAHSLVGAIFDSVYITLAEEVKNKPPEKDIEEVFPGGVVRTPFKQSDLARLLRSKEKKKEFDPIELPVLGL